MRIIICALIFLFKTSSFASILNYKSAEKSAFSCNHFLMPSSITVDLEKMKMILGGCAYDDCEGRYMEDDFNISMIKITKESKPFLYNLVVRNNVLECSGLVEIKK